jgi:hypothetical protein
MNWTALFILLSLGLGAALFFTWRRLTSAPTSLPVTANWIEDLSPERYRPMMHLLDAEDFQFLETQPGYSASMGRRLRAQRCQLFRCYLSSLTADFQRVIMALKLILLCSTQDRPELASALVGQQVRFAVTLAGVHIRLFLFRWDVCRVDVSRLVGIFDCMRLELQALVPANAELAA